jgi:hypothetical protein
MDWQTAKDREQPIQLIHLSAKVEPMQIETKGSRFFPNCDPRDRPLSVFVSWFVLSALEFCDALSPNP